ncbi:MAG TPA: hypothetical protein DIU37_03930 [Opitutae bacterium]|nr:hypothetical protein [Opitutae bacterium]
MAAKAATITVWRLFPEQTAWDPFDGEGARLYGGRWNPRGVPMVYAASTQALAVLEILVHLQGLSAQRAYLAYPLTFPEPLSRCLDVDALPEDWSSDEPSECLKAIGKEWAQSHASVALAVPSAIIPHEYNYLINPTHPEFKSVKQGDPVPLSLDPRLLN